MAAFLKNIATAAVGAAVGAVIGVIGYHGAVAEGTGNALTIAEMVSFGSSFGGVAGFVIYRLRSWRDRGDRWTLLAWAIAGAAGVFIPALLGYYFHGDIQFVLFSPIIGLFFGMGLGATDAYLSS